MLNFPHSFHPTIYAIIIASLMPILFSMVAKVLGGFTFKDNENPRAFLDKLGGVAQRANAVQKNSFEVLPFFLASVILSMLLVVPQGTINKLAIIFVIVRLMYAAAYLLNLHVLRSMLWLLAMACPLLMLRICLINA